MKTLGLVGGTGWISTVEYYRIINEEINRRLGGLQFARCIIYSVNYADIAAFNAKREYDGVAALIAEAAVRVMHAGADGIVLCANTLHRYTDRVEQAIHVPLIHIGDATGDELVRRGLGTVGLLGTRQTMELDFYKSRLKRQGIDALVPEPDDMDYIQRVIEQELLRGILRDDSRERFKGIACALGRRGCQAVVLGCTEIPLLLRPDDIDLPVVNTLDIHCLAAVDFALQ